ncbi:protein IQ-DOMAIN 1 [Tripterygium wilfordii]|uniref:Protein IQ-DOMAIN 1 n=1 Tax=Tripterygium wilfordii TaxID=458696 RepID=A0A7J7D866_TRIWF|nr:protein IQ-DOMAIN 1-like [Tripterygium wilfordii]KAF5742522.1 protein IQ-DOMAIN 1 [Tripterygium wilfordii]
MGKKGNWFSAVKKALSPDSKNKKEQKSNKSKKWFGSKKSLDPVSLSEETAELDVPLAPPPPAIEDAKLVEGENEQSKHFYSVAFSTAVAAEAAVAAAQAAAEVTSTVSRYSGKSKEEIAAIKIQTAFRGYLARRALRALRGLVRLKSLIQGPYVKRQATTTLRCMQTLARVQSQICVRRIRISDENQALERQLQQKREKELEKLRASVGEEWNDSAKSKEEVEANLQSRQEAAMRRERALAYAHSHQQMGKNSSKSANTTFMDPNNPHWGWSWLERWMAARPWESRSAVDNNDHSSIKSTTSCAMSVGEISKSYSRRDNKPSPTGPKLSRPPSRQSPSTPPSKAPSASSVTKMTKQASLRGNGLEGDDDSRSTFSVQSQRYRRHSIATSSVRDDESLASSPAVPSYMTPTQSATAKSRPSPLGLDKNGTPDKGSVGSAKKRLSFPASPAGPRRHSGPPGMETCSIKDVVVQMEEI